MLCDSGNRNAKNVRMVLKNSRSVIRLLIQSAIVPQVKLYGLYRKTSNKF